MWGWIFLELIPKMDTQISKSAIVEVSLTVLMASTEEILPM